MRNIFSAPQKSRTKKITFSDEELYEISKIALKHKDEFFDGLSQVFPEYLRNRNVEIVQLILSGIRPIFICKEKGVSRSVISTVLFKSQDFISEFIKNHQNHENHDTL
jgi:hypothetical protein